MEGKSIPRFIVVVVVVIVMVMMVVVGQSGDDCSLRTHASKRAHTHAD